MLEALLSLNALPKIGPVRIRRLLDHFGCAEKVLKADKDRLMRIDGIGPELAEILLNASSLCDPVAELKELRERGLSVITPEDPDFPATLREAYDRPILLYVWGKLEERDRHAIGIVGTRRASIYGKNSTQKLSYHLARSGFTIVSGLALGVDTFAHEAAIAAGGRTVGVIGSGLARLYPGENMALAEKIADGHGAIVSEFPLHTPPDKQTFPQRNRIVAAWSKALIVTECPTWSGSLITANLAAEYGRPIYAVPGPIDKPTSGGCNQLIRNGATLLTDAGEILEDLGGLALDFKENSKSSPASAPAPVTVDLTDEERQIFEALGDSEHSIDHLVDLSGQPAPVVSTCLLKLEMKKLVRALPGFRYVRR
ncbi:MAG: DNA-processing protein DprA [Akkermansiaceae bacterium]|jgi:DNA processing protein|nr:DNA-processing protein DprA [Akkermansiaceae bacterium]